MPKNKSVEEDDVQTTEGEPEVPEIFEELDLTDFPEPDELADQSKKFQSRIPKPICVEGVVGWLVGSTVTDQDRARAKGWIPAKALASPEGTRGRGFVLNEEEFTVNEKFDLCWSGMFVYIRTEKMDKYQRSLELKDARETLPKKVKKGSKTEGNYQDVGVHQTVMKKASVDSDSDEE